MNPLVQGALVFACGVVGLFFLRFWRDTRDRFFAFFSASFFVLALHWAILALTDPTFEHRPLFYILRFLAFGLIMAAILDKNRGQS
ncbi:MAG: hypothetical protein HYR85_19330 [Planctomycetes bacterium]|nr:hypothetical protein [Planctomycetota bacterium]MBI3843738.1 hypothetical protein [Planctomycetota bacterium]